MCRILKKCIWVVKLTFPTMSIILDITLHKVTQWIMDALFIGQTKHISLCLTKPTGDEEKNREQIKMVNSETHFLRYFIFCFHPMFILKLNNLLSPWFFYQFTQFLIIQSVLFSNLWFSLHLKKQLIILLLVLVWLARLIIN